MFSCEFCKISKKTFFTEYLWVTAYKKTIIDVWQGPKYVSACFFKFAFSKLVGKISQ